MYPERRTKNEMKDEQMSCFGLFKHLSFDFAGNEGKVSSFIYKMFLVSSDEIPLQKKKLQYNHTTG